jgi:hypothetical protein
MTAPFAVKHLRTVSFDIRSQEYFMKCFNGVPTSYKFLASAGAAILLSTLTGCSLGTMQLSGPAPVASVSVHMTGAVHGGQQPVKGAKIQLWAVGSGAYGAGAHELTSTTTTNYHPGGATGCSTTPATITAYAIASNVFTFTGANTLAVGDYVTLGGFTTAAGRAIAGSGQFIVASASATSFTAQSLTGFSYADTATTVDAGTSTATCYSYVVSDYNGNYALTGDFSCGAYTASNVYITATGGNPGLLGGTYNTASKMVDLLYASPATSGAPVPMTCNNLSSATVSFVNEVTTTAAAVALAQYYGAGGFGGPTSTQGAIGFNNAFVTAGLLANATTGNAVASTSLTGTGGTIVATPDPNKINTIADVLAACVNSTGGTAADATSSNPTNCGTLFADVTPTGGTAPTDTLGAAVLMTTNPISNNSNGSAANLTALYGLAQGTGAPYPTVASQVTDWTIGISYISAAALPEPLDLKVDSGGNVWVISNPGGLTEITPGGVPAFYSATFGSASTSISASNPRNLAIDTNNNIYIATSSSPYNEVKYVPGTAATAATLLTFTGAPAKSPYGITIDGNNDVFMGLQSSSATVEIVEFPTGNFSLSSYITYPIASATPGTAGTSGSNTYVVPEYMATDTNGNVWFTGGSGTNPGAAVELTNINTSSCSAFPCTLTTSTTANTFVTSSGGGQSEPYALAANAGGTMWVANVSNSSVTAIADAGGTNNNAPGAATGYAPTGGFSAPHYLATDGSGNVWVANKNTGTPPSGGTVSEISSTGVLLSETPISPAAAPLGFAHVGLASGEGIAVDPSGNVWIANFVAGTGGVEEIVGAATPTVTPIALTLKNGTINTRP